MTTLSCSICGADRSKTGRLFDEATLAKHKARLHADADIPNGAAPLACDTCGATRSLRGKPFLTQAHLIQHKRKVHPGDAEPERRAKPKAARIAAPAAAHHVKFCPHCGFNLEVVHAAMEFVNGNHKS